MITDLISYDGNAFGTDYEVGFVKASEPRLPPSNIQVLERVGAWPVIVALQRNKQSFALLIRIAGSSYDSLRTQLFQWFDPEDEDPKTLVGENHNGIEMSVECLCQELRVYGDLRRDTVFVATMVVSDDVRWRATTDTTDSWNVTASGQTHTINNSGELEVYPVYTIKPTSTKAGSYDYRRWVPIKWRSENAGAQYPIRAELDTATIVSAGNMLASGDDLRVLADGTEIDRWLDSMNSAATAIWFNLDFAGAPQLTLATAIASSGDIASIEVDDENELAKLPESGIVLIDSEAFTYTAKNLTDKQLTGITREAKGTSAAAHTVGDTVHWIQHDVWILHGNASVGAPTVDDDYKPMFELDTSTNTSWDYNEFGDGDNHRAGRWSHIYPFVPGAPYGNYTGTEDTYADPWTVLGLWVEEAPPNVVDYQVAWDLYNPCGIVNAAWANGKKWQSSDYDDIDDERFRARVAYWVSGDSYWTTQAWIDEPTASETWESWSESAAASDWDPAQRLMLKLDQYTSKIEAGDVTVSLDADSVPDVSIGAQQGNYRLECTLANQTTGESISLDFVMDVDSEIEIDTDERTLTWLEDGSRQFQARSLSSARKHWLRLVAGNNTLQFTDAGTGNVTITTAFARRYY